jgi:hypothetical protein
MTSADETAVWLWRVSGAFPDVCCVVQEQSLECLSYPPGMEYTTVPHQFVSSAPHLTDRWHGCVYQVPIKDSVPIFRDATQKRGTVRVRKQREEQYLDKPILQL